MVVLRILSFSLTLSILLSMARWLVPILFFVFLFVCLFSNAFVRDHVWHSYVIAGKTHCLKTILFRLIGRCLSGKIFCTFQKHSILAFSQSVI